MKIINRVISRVNVTWTGIRSNCRRGSNDDTCHTKNPRGLRRFFSCIVAKWHGSEGFDVCGLKPLLALGDLERHRLAFLKGAESLCFDAGVVDKQVFAALIGSYETVPFLIVEPLDCTVGHANDSLPVRGGYLGYTLKRKMGKRPRVVTVPP
jgi:hypothetical protein